MTKVALFYPSTYSVAMSSLIVHRLYFWLNDLDNVYVERAFLPTPRGGPTAVRGLEGGTPLGSFDYIIAPIHYELDYVNMVRALLGSGVELLASRRSSPRIILGGPTVTANPEPLANLADAVILGDLEPVKGWLRRVLDEGEPLEPSEEGVYMPSYGKHEVKVAVSLGVPASDPRRVLAPEAPFTITVEASRGCPFSCAFCLESYITKPYRERDLKEVVNEASELYARYHQRVRLLGLTLNARRDFKDLLNNLMERGVDFSLPSMRAELLDEESLELIARAGQRTITVAPETSERLRLALGKSSRDEDFLRVAKAAARLGLTLKLYAMIGLPGEAEDDLKALTDLIANIKRTGVRVELSVNPFVVKPQTPLQWLPMMPEGELNRRMHMLKQLTPHDSFASYDPFDALVQGAVGISDRDVIKYLIEVAQAGGGRGAWRRAASEGLLNAVLKPRESPLPWSHVRGFFSEAELRIRLEGYLEAVGLKLKT